MIKKYRINEGNHKAGFHFCPLICPKKLNFKALFRTNCIYTLEENGQLDEDQFDINKLYGFSRGYHQKNSARFGWRSKENSIEEIEIFAYVYSNGTRIKIHITDVRVEEWANYEIKREGYFYTFRVNYRGQNFEEVVPIDKPGFFLGYRLYPYFGGNEKAPHDMEIYIRKI